MNRTFRWLLRTAAVLAAVVTALSAAMAGIDTSWDWTNDPATSKPKRKLKVCYKFNEATCKLGDKLLKDVMDTAIANWNGVKADTGWEFEKATTNCDIEIKCEKITDSKGNHRSAGGASVSGFPADGAKDRKVSKLTIKFDPKPAEGLEWDTKGKDKEKTKNPVGSAKHELSHTIRLDHQGGTRSVTKKIKDPQGRVTAGDDVTTISADDKAEAKTASTAAITVAAAAGAPGVAAVVAVPAFPDEIPIPWTTPPGPIEVAIPGNAFLNPVMVSLSRSGINSLPGMFNVPYGIPRIVKGARIDVTGQMGLPMLEPEVFFSITIPYEDGLEGEGFLIDLSDREFYPIEESTVRPFIYNPHISEWKPAPGYFTLDMMDDVIHMNIPCSELIRFPDPEELWNRTLYVGISGENVPVDMPSLWAAREQPDGTKVRIGNPLAESTAVVTAVFPPNILYIEEQNRSAGIRVQTDLLSPSIGNRINVMGIMETNPHGERYLAAQSVGHDSDTVDIGALGTSQSAFKMPGVETTGLLMRLWGSVNEFMGTSFYLNDGSDLFSNSGIPGMKVYTDWTMAPVTWAIVTGVRSQEIPPGGIQPEPVLLPRNPDDVVPLVP